MKKKNNGGLCKMHNSVLRIDFNNKITIYFEYTLHMSIVVYDFAFGLMNGNVEVVNIWTNSVQNDRIFFRKNTHAIDHLR